MHFIYSTRCCFHLRPACNTVGHLWLWSRPTTSKTFSYPSGLTDGSRWILVSSTRWRIRWLPDRYSRHMNCISSRSSSRPSTSLPWEPAVYRNSGSPGQQVDVERRRERRTDKYAVAVINCPAGTTCWSMWKITHRLHALLACQKSQRRTAWGHCDSFLCCRCGWRWGTFH